MATSSGKLVGGVERTVDQSDVARVDDPPRLHAPRVPSIGVGDVHDRVPRARNREPDGVRIFVAVRDGERRHADAGVEGEQGSGRGLTKLDLPRSTSRLHGALALRNAAIRGVA